MPGRPRKITKRNKSTPGAKPTPIDPKMLQNLCSIGATWDELGAVFDLHPDSLRDRVVNSPVLQHAMAKGRGVGKVTLRRMQWEGAKKGNATMLIWLGKQLLGQRDKHDVKIEEAEPPDLSQCSTEELAIIRQAAAIMRKASAPLVLEHSPEPDAEDDQAA